MPNSQKSSKSLLIIILILAAVLRFFNLMHDALYFFDPDERNMTGSVSQLALPAKLSEIPKCIFDQFSARNYQRYNSKGERPVYSIRTDCNLDPHFYAYGQFPLYLAFISDQITKPLFIPLLKKIFPDKLQIPNDQRLSSSFPSAIFWLRFYSAYASSLTVILVYRLCYILLSGNNRTYLHTCNCLHVIHSEYV